MEYSVPISIGVLLIVAGLALFAASYRFTRLARLSRVRMERILALAGQPIDPLDIPSAAWPDLAAAGWQSLTWTGHWFGQPVAGQIKSPSAPYHRGTPLNFDFSSGDDVNIALTLLHQQSFGEERVFADHLARVFALLLESRMHARTEALAAALAERARLSLYVQHDMRNLAQWVGWITQDFLDADTPDQLLATARRLRENAALAKDRSERLVAALGKQPLVEHATEIDIKAAIEKAAGLAGIEANVVGEGTVCIAPGQLARVLDNLFSNLAAGWRDTLQRGPDIRILRNQAGDGLVAEFHSPLIAETQSLADDKLFEPFSSGRAGGLGLGLYQARKTMRETGGDLTAVRHDDGLHFHLSLPRRTP
jgi:signal transduction histidine kinase